MTAAARYKIKEQRGLYYFILQYNNKTLVTSEKFFTKDLAVDAITELKTYVHSDSILID